MTWWHGDGRFEVFFNRDELKTRAPASPPELLESAGGVRFLAPRDPAAGGTWMLANEHRVTVCLLNRWHEAAPEGGACQSRGLLVSAMADCSSAHEVMQRLRKTGLACYRPFTMVAIDSGHVLGAAWNGQRLSDEQLIPPLTSSSYRFEEVAAARREAFSNIPGNDPGSLWEFQCGGPSASAYTVRMNRPDAQTWSRSRVCVSEHSILWEYIEETPDLVGEGTLHTVELTRITPV